jgi:predicted dienelactone hydrolase
VCAGDCSDNGAVGIDELITLVNISLGTESVSACMAGDADNDGAVTVDEIIRAVSVALDGCPLLPWQPGPFGVGYRRMTFTKESVTEPGKSRVMDTWLWYPADPATASLHTNPRGRAGVPIVANAGPRPLLMFSHGSCGIPTQSLFLTTVLASYGFVVAAPPHPGNVLSPTCETEAALDDAFVNRPADISFVIGELLALDDTADSFLHAAIDPARIGVVGHSFGGLTALRVSALDARVIAGLALAPAIEPPWGGPTVEEEIARIDVPMMLQGGDLDTLTPFEPTSQRAYDLLGPPRYLVEILNIGHFGFSDICVPPCGVPGMLTQGDAHRATLRYAVPFLLKWVGGDSQFDVFLAPVPGIVFTADIGQAAM